MKEGKIIPKSYGSIPHLSISKLNQQADKKIDATQESILTKKTRDKQDIIFVTEKVDGTNVAIYKYNDQLFALARKGYEAVSSPYKHVRLFKDYLDQNLVKFNELLKNGERICSEWMIKTISLEYDIPHEPFIAFDIIDSNNKRICYDEFKERCNKYEIITTKLIHKGSPIEIHDAMNKLVGFGFHGCLEQPEGIVYRCERNGKIDFLAKYVRDCKIDGEFMQDQTKWNKWRGYTIKTNY